MPPRSDTQTDALNDSHVAEAIKRGLIEIKGDRITYNLGTKKTYNWADQEEWVRARTVAFLVVARGYPINRIRTEVQVPRRTPGDFADIVVYRDDRCRDPYLVVENKSIGQTAAARKQWIEQAFGNANSLRAPLAPYDEHVESRFYDVANIPLASELRTSGAAETQSRHNTAMSLSSRTSPGKKTISLRPSQASSRVAFGGHTRSVGRAASAIP